MPNNVYIGSRYVPIFDGDWDNTKVYEALTIVNYNGSSYTSKKPVPAGTLPTNTNYWALTGNYNGQISNLQQQINDCNTAITANSGKIGNLSNLKTTDQSSLVHAVNETYADTIRADGAFMGKDITNKRFIFMGDSYAEGAICTGLNPSTYTRNYADGWMSKLITYLGLDSDHAIASPTGGASFALTGGQHWQDLLTTLGGTVTNPGTVDYIVVMGGANDFGETEASILTGMASFENVRHTYFPNATVLIGMIGNVNRSYGQANTLKTFNAYKNGCTANGFIFMSGMENISHWPDYMGIDFLHMTANGYTAIAKAANDFIRGSGVDFKIRKKITTSDVTASWGSGVGSVVSSITASEWIDNNMAGIEIENLTIQVTNNATAFNGATLNALVVADAGFTIVGDAFPPTGYGSSSAFLIAHSVANGFTVMHCTVTVGDRFIYVASFELNNNNWFSIADCNSVQLIGANIHLPTIQPLIHS